MFLYYPSMIIMIVMSIQWYKYDGIYSDANTMNVWWCSGGHLLSYFYHPHTHMYMHDVCAHIHVDTHHRLTNTLAQAWAEWAHTPNAHIHSHHRTLNGAMTLTHTSTHSHIHVHAHAHSLCHSSGSSTLWVSSGIPNMTIWRASIMKRWTSHSVLFQRGGSISYMLECQPTN